MIAGVLAVVMLITAGTAGIECTFAAEQKPEQTAADQAAPQTTDQAAPQAAEQITPQAAEQAATQAVDTTGIHDIFKAKDSTKLERFQARVLNRVLYCDPEIDVSDLNITDSEIQYTVNGNKLSGTYAAREIIRQNPFYSAAATTGFPEFTYQENGCVKTVKYTYHPAWTPDFSRKVIAGYDDAMALIKSGDSDFAKALKLHDWVVKNVSYGMSSLYPDFALGALGNRKAVCAGYAQCYQFLLSQAGVQSIYVAANTTTEPHAWNLVKIEDHWFHVDCTWDRGLGTNPTVKHTYFMLNDDEFNADGAHTEDWKDPAKGYPSGNLCSIENKFYQDNTDIATDAQIAANSVKIKHAYDSSAAWHTSETEHWHTCTAGVEIRGKHTGTNSCTICGYKKKLSDKTATISLVKKAGKTFELNSSAGQSTGQYDVVQGSCTDGTYAYYILYNKSNEKCRILKSRLSDNATVKVSGVLNLGTDVTYNSDLKKLVVAHYSGSPYRLSVIDPNSLTVTSYKDVKIPGSLEGVSSGTLAGIQGFSAVAYNSNRHQYVVRIIKSHDYLLLDANMTPVKYVAVSKAGGNLYQGIDASSEYIYDVQSKAGSYNTVIVYDWNGEYQYTAKIPTKYEMESLFHNGDKFYAAVYTSYYQTYYTTHYKTKQVKWKKVKGKWRYKTKYVYKTVKYKAKWKKVRGKWKYKTKKKKVRVTYQVAHKRLVRNNYVYDVGTL